MDSNELEKYNSFFQKLGVVGGIKKLLTRCCETTSDQKEIIPNLRSVLDDIEEYLGSMEGGNHEVQAEENS